MKPYPRVDTLRYIFVMPPFQTTVHSYSCLTKRVPAGKAVPNIVPAVRLLRGHPAIGTHHLVPLAGVTRDGRRHSQNHGENNQARTKHVSFLRVNEIS